MNTDLLFSSKTVDWETPQDLFDRLNAIHHFEIDLCATADNTKCERYFSPEDDALAQEWTGVCWCNPPYGRQVGKWVQKAAQSKAKVVMLLFARTDTQWFHKWVLPFATIEFLPGRLHFGGAGRAPAPSMIVVFDGRRFA